MNVQSLLNTSLFSARVAVQSPNMHRALAFATDALAVARLTRLVTADKISEPLREEIERHGPEQLAYLVTCPYCVSVWAGLAVASGAVPTKIKYALALSEIETITRRALDALPTRWS